MVEDTGGLIDLDKLPVGDPTLSEKKSLVTSLKKEWLVIGQKDIDTLQKTDRERAPMYQVGDVTGDHRTFDQKKTGAKPMDLLWKTLEVLQKWS
jgi:phosphoribosylformylglycinamidine synthase